MTYCLPDASDPTRLGHWLCWNVIWGAYALKATCFPIPSAMMDWYGCTKTLSSSSSRHESIILHQNSARNLYSALFSGLLCFRQWTNGFFWKVMPGCCPVFALSLKTPLGLRLSGTSRAFNENLELANPLRCLAEALCLALKERSDKNQAATRSMI